MLPDKELLKKLYPIGSLFFTKENPFSSFGFGKWEKVEYMKITTPDGDTCINYAWRRDE